MIQGGLLVTATVLVLLNLAVDLLYAVFDPRVKYDNR
jgi:peptide/nickel transport system permease protein